MNTQKAQYYQLMAEFQTLSDSTFGLPDIPEATILAAYRTHNKARTLFVRTEKQFPVPAAMLSETATAMWASVGSGDE